LKSSSGIVVALALLCAKRFRRTEIKKQQGRFMKLFWGLGKILTLGFWLVVLVNAVVVLPNPFDVLIKLAGGFLLLTHLLEVLLFNGSLRGRPHPWRDRLQIVFFGIFHLQSLGRRQAEVHHA
jgi:putative membrane protein